MAAVTSTETVQVEHKPLSPLENRFINLWGTLTSGIALGFANLFESGAWNSFPKMADVSPEMITKSKEILPLLGGKSFEAIAAILAVATLDKVLAELPPDNDLLKIQELIKNSPSLLINHLVTSIKANILEAEARDNNHDDYWPYEKHVQTQSEHALQMENAYGIKWREHPSVLAAQQLRPERIIGEE